MLLDYGIILLFIVFGMLFVLVNICVSKLLSRLFGFSKSDPRKRTTYECGEQPVGNSRVRFNPRFYLVALVFLIFEIEAIFLFPILVVFQTHTAVALLGGGIFLGLLVLGLIYDWAQGDLDWVKPEPRFTEADI